MSTRLGLILLVAGLLACGQMQDPLASLLDRAYKALAEKQYPQAVELFAEAVEAAPERVSIRKDLAYTYLRTGETEAARDQFEQVMRIDPLDQQAALEYAFLCHETGKTDIARRVFDQIRRDENSPYRATAEAAFQNIDRPLAEGLARWLQALELQPDDYNAHREVAILAERRGELALAAEHYLKAWRLRPEWRSMLVAYGRIEQARGEPERAMAALLAASRGPEPRAAEAARKLLPDRYPYVYEFRQAIELDPDNIALREELVYLLEAMGRREEAARELAAIPQAQRPGAGAGTVRSADVRALAERSYQAGYLRDALKYYLMAHEEDPLDFRVMLQLGWTLNVMGRDEEAFRWFGLARKSPDASIAREAGRAYSNLRPSQARFRTTVWLFPVFSSRGRDVFAYGQVRTELKLGRLPLRTYFSTRLIGDSQGMVSSGAPKRLADNAAVLAAGVTTNSWQGFIFWFEAGEAVRYAWTSAGRRFSADLRGGAAFYRGFGRLLGSGHRGAHVETNDDFVFLSRFDNDALLYSQNRAGYTLAPLKKLGGLETQWSWNLNLSRDIKRAYWANTVETGPGVRFRWERMPRPWVFSFSVLRGAYLIREGNPWGRRYTDYRAGIWYAFTR